MTWEDVRKTYSNQWLIIDNIVLVEIVLAHKDQSLHSGKFLVDTGSASTFIAADIAIQLGLGPEPNDVIREIRGVCGAEV